MKAYIELTKAGIVSLVLISVTAGYLCGHPFELDFNWPNFVLTLLGIYCVAAGSAALNQVQEMHIDAKMPRTAKRPLPSGKLTKTQALVFVIILLLIGLGILAYLDPALLILGAIAVFSYNVLYTLWWKQKWAFAAVPGAIPGALPVVMGFIASSGDVWSIEGWYLFLILFFWQMPHFWVLALRYKTDYKKGGIPTLPVIHGGPVTVRQIIVWCLSYLSLALMAPLFIQLRWIYLVPALIVTGFVAWELYKFVKSPEDHNWIRFFLWVTFSIAIYFAAMVADLWSVYPMIPLLTR